MTVRGVQYGERVNVHTLYIDLHVHFGSIVINSTLFELSSYSMNAVVKT